jgi:hypothetical protein
VSAGISGIRTERNNLQGDAISGLVAGSAKASLKLAIAGACLGLLPSYLGRRRHSVTSALVIGAAGSALGFCAGFTWKTRKVSYRVAHSVASELRRASDQHWLEMNPIDYA